MAYHDMVGVGASAGGVQALRVLMAGLPAGLPAAVLVVLHLPRNAPSALPQILSRAGPLPAGPATDGELLVPGSVYVAPADRHLLVRDGRVLLGRDPAEHGHRPAVDALFRSIAGAAGPRGIAVVLSGNGSDGAAGAVSVAARGGRVVVQSPEEAQYASMPRATLAAVAGADVVAVARLGAWLAELIAGPVAEPA